MRKYLKLVFVFILGMVLILGVSACKKDNPDPTPTPTPEPKLQMVCPSGSPSIVQMYLQQDSKRYETTRVAGPDTLPAHFNEGKMDLIIAPTNIGVKLYNKAKNENIEFKYELGANVVFGNIYILSKEKLAFADLAGKTILAFGEHASPGLLLKYLLKENNITNATINWLSGGGDVREEMVKNPDTTIALIPEPAATAVQMKLKQLGKDIVLNRIRLLDVYNEKMGTDSGFPQASLYIKKSLAKEVKERVLADLKASIEKVLNNLDQAAQDAETILGDMKAPLIKASVPNMMLKFVSGADAKTICNQYFEILKGLDPQSVGGKLPEDDFYFLG